MRATTSPHASTGSGGGFRSSPDIEVPSRLSDNVTLSTMHGCPPDEIGAISEYLLSERGLHTSVKLNPTLLGPETVRGILNDSLGFTDIAVPDEAFAHDLVFADAVSLIGGLRAAAGRAGLQFGVKLTNTLEVRNHRRVFDASAQTMYLSGRPLHALTVSLAHHLTEALDEPLLMSFSGGADAANSPALLRCGLRTVTVCSDLLKPGGYLRFGQYLENIENAMEAAGAVTLPDFVRSGSPSSPTVEAAAAHNLAEYAAAALSEPAYHADTFHRDHTKTTRRLGLFDCIHAPCTDICDVDQNVPEYMRRVRDGDLAGAAAVTLDDNPLASILGRTCHNPCEPVCLRTHMDRPLAIREIKRFITDHEQAAGEDRRGTFVRTSRRGRGRRTVRSRGRHLSRARRPQRHCFRGASFERRHGLRHHPRLPGAPPRGRPRSRADPSSGGRIPIRSECRRRSLPGGAARRGVRRHRHRRRRPPRPAPGPRRRKC